MAQLVASAKPNHTGVWVGTREYVYNRVETYSVETVFKAFMSIVGKAVLARTAYVRRYNERKQIVNDARSRLRK